MFSALTFCWPDAQQIGVLYYVLEAYCKVYKKLEILPASAIMKLGPINLFPTHISVYL